MAKRCAARHGFPGLSSPSPQNSENAKSSGHATDPRLPGEHRHTSTHTRTHTFTHAHTHTYTTCNLDAQEMQGGGIVSEHKDQDQRGPAMGSRPSAITLRWMNGTRSLQLLPGAFSSQLSAGQVQRLTTNSQCLASPISQHLSRPLEMHVESSHTTVSSHRQ